MMGWELYVHKKYFPLKFILTPYISLKVNQAYEEAVQEFKKQHLGWRYRCVRVNIITLTVRLDEAPNFDTAREPQVGRWFFYHKEAHDVHKCFTGFSNAIWHHKWLWVKPSYEGFDVQESQAWSETYVPLLQEPPKGFLDPWEKQLLQVGLK